MLDQVFLSYSSSDREFAVRLASALERSGLSVWWDAKLADGIPFDRQIKDALAESVAIVALISREALKSKWVRWEIAQAPAGGMHVVPVLTGEIPSEELPKPVAAFSPMRWKEPVDPLALEIDVRIREQRSTMSTSSKSRDAYQREVLDHISYAASQLIWRNVGVVRISRPPIVHTSSHGLASFLARHRLAIAFTSFQAHAIYLVQQEPSGRIALSVASFPRATALCVSRDHLHISTHDSLHALVRVAGKRPGEVNYLPRSSCFTGALDVHDLRVRANGEAIFANTRYNCLATLASRANFRTIWKPPFLGAIADGDRCHLNGLAVNDDRPTFCTVVSPSNTVDGWREQPIGSGLVIDVENSQVACDGLTFPHMPRHHDGKLWILNAGEGEFGFVDFSGGSKGRFIAVAVVAGFARGLAFYERFAVVGTSKPRHGLLDGLPIHCRMKESGEHAGCGFQVIDTRNGECVEWFRMEGVLPSEISALEVIPDTLAIQAYSPDSEIASEFISWEE
jgi:uncharacterized protein (TIGR03032 family)